MNDESTHRGRYNRDYLPHIDIPEHSQMITFRLGDALPREVVEGLEAEDESQQRAVRTEKYLDAGYGACLLRKPRAAEIVEGAFEFYEGDRYTLHDWVVMPNHVHVSYGDPTEPMGRIVGDWKSYTSSAIQKFVELPDEHPFWQRGYYDRYLRDRFHFFNVRCYIWLNPVKAGFVDHPFDWPYSSIHRYREIGLEDSLRTWFRDWERDFWEAPWSE